MKILIEMPTEWSKSHLGASGRALFEQARVPQISIDTRMGLIPGGYSTLSWVRMCGPKFRPPPYNKTREDANLLTISKPFVSWRALFKNNQCFLQCKLGCISTFWQPIDKPKDKFIGNYAFCKNATYIKTNFQIKKGPLQNLRARKSTLSGPHIPVPTFLLSTPPPGTNHWSAFLAIWQLISHLHLSISPTRHLCSSMSNEFGWKFTNKFKNPVFFL